MSSKLDDLRRRVLQHPPPEGIAEPPADAAVSFKAHDSDHLKRSQRVLRPS